MPVLRHSVPYPNRHQRQCLHLLGVLDRVERSEVAPSHHTEARRFAAGWAQAVRLSPLPISGATPDMFRLGDTANAMRASGSTLRADSEAGCIWLDGALPEWAVTCLRLHADHLVYWWRHSPSVIAVCDVCGEWKLAGKRSTIGSHCYMGGRYKVKTLPVIWGCQGTFRLVDLPWAAARPKRRRVKVAA